MQKPRTGEFALPQRLCHVVQESHTVSHLNLWSTRHVQRKRQHRGLLSAHLEDEVLPRRLLDSLVGCRHVQRAHRLQPLFK